MTTQNKEQQTHQGGAGYIQGQGVYVGAPDIQAQGGYVCQQGQSSPEFTSPADFAAQAHQALLGWGQTLSDEAQRTRFEKLASVDDPAAFARAAGQEMARHYMLLDALALRFAWHVTQSKPEREDPAKAGKWLDLATKASREARRCLALAAELSQDTRAVGYMGKIGQDGTDD